jgi:porphobilinogen synthase
MSKLGRFPTTRLRRLRYSEKIRQLVNNTSIDVTKLVYPLFIKEGNNIKQAISTMPGQFQWSIDQLQQELEEITALGIKHVMLFGIPAKKDPTGSSSWSSNGVIQSAIPVIKQYAPTLTIFVDVCFCEYTDHGHCGPLDPATKDVDNDHTLELLAKQAVSLATAGADVMTPSGAIDGMVTAIRNGLDAAGFQHIPILAHSVKYASSFYGPFREAAEGAPQFGDRRTYQLDFARNAEDAIRECGFDIEEGADMIMVKPAHTYLDILRSVKNHFGAVPLGAYHTSGEFAMLKAAGTNGWIDEKKAVHETLIAIFRAGADFIITYYAKEVAAWSKHSNKSLI